MKRLLIALVLLVISIPAWPIQKDYEKTPLRLDSYEWITVWDNTQRPRPHDATTITFNTGERRLISGFISFRKYGRYRNGSLIRENGQEVFCLNSGGCWPVWDRGAK